MNMHMEKFLITLIPAEKDGLDVTFVNNFRNVDAATEYARLQLMMACGAYHEAKIASSWNGSDLCFRQCVDPIVYNNNL